MRQYRFIGLSFTCTFLDISAMLSRRIFLMRSGQFVAAASLASLTTTTHNLVHAAGFAAPTMPPLLAPLRPQLPAPDAPLEVKIGQMIMVGFAGRYIGEQSTIYKAVKEKHIGSVVLFRPNIESPVQLLNLTRTLQAAAEYPMLIATDQEGGKVSRLTGNFSLPYNYSEQYLGTQNDLDATQAQGESTGQILSQFGINMNLAPVVDLNVNPRNPIIGRFERSYSADPAVVVNHAKAAIEGHRKHNVLCTLKHFPGHGSSTGDTHVGFVDVTDTWSEAELQPFAELAKQQSADAIMTAHIFNGKLDAARPATLSRNILTGILREKLGYQSVIISDDMHMRAIAGLYSNEEAVYFAIDAGVDILAISNNIPSSKKLSATSAVEIITKLVVDGKISPERIDQSFQRILALKNKLAIPAA